MHSVKTLNSQASHPLKYQEYVEQYSREFGIDKYLLYAFIKTESSFEPDAKSSAGAIGLTQITEETFSWLKLKLCPKEEIVFEDDSTLKISGLFVAVGVASSLDFARKLGAEIQNNKLVVNELMQTNLPGLYACGDAVKGTPQIAKAVYEGMVAGMEASKYVRNLK